jgi:uncharacterized membrane protein YeaQ/YmgE (transglycosylase-associated protein family)
MEIGDLLIALIGGTTIGLLGKWVSPTARDEMPLWLTIICGIGGVLIGTYLYSRFVGPTIPGVDWWRHVWQVAAAIILVAGVESLALRRTARRVRSPGRARPSGRREAR